MNVVVGVHFFVHFTQAHCFPAVQVQLVHSQAALLERRRAMERANLDEEGEAMRALEAIALEKSRGVQVGVKSDLLHQLLMRSLKLWLIN